MASWQRGSLLGLVAILATICSRGWGGTAVSYGHLRSPGSAIPQQLDFNRPFRLPAYFHKVVSFLRKDLHSRTFAGFLTPDFLPSQIVGEGLCSRMFFCFVFYLITTRMTNFSLQSDINLTVLNLSTKSRCDSPMDRHFEGTSPAQSQDRVKLCKIWSQRSLKFEH